MSRYKTVLPLLTALAAIAHAQTPEPKFEVSTVKLRKSGTPYHFYDCAGDRFLFSGPILGNLLQWTYDTRGGTYRQFAGSVSIPGEFYEIEAKAAGPIESVAQCRLMVQALLADRFKLSMHWEEQEGDIFDLLVARGGSPKMPQALPTAGAHRVSAGGWSDDR